MVNLSSEMAAILNMAWMGELGRRVRGGRVRPWMSKQRVRRLVETSGRVLRGVNRASWPISGCFELKATPRRDQGTVRLSGFLGVGTDFQASHHEIHQGIPRGKL